MEWLIWLISAAFVLSGCVLMLLGGLGLLRMPDLYTRLHAASVTDTGAVMLICAGLLLLAVFIFGSVMAAIKVCLILFFTLFTAPTASHALAKTALLGGLVPVGKNGNPLLASADHAKQMANSSQPDPEVDINHGSKYD